MAFQLNGFRGFRCRGFAPVSLGVPRALQLSRYPPHDGVSAALYRPHLDGYTYKPWSLRAFAHRLKHPGQSAVAARQMTAILYLQDPGAFEVAKDEGGELVLHLTEPVRVSPICGRLVLFDSKSGFGPLGAQFRCCSLALLALLSGSPARGRKREKERERKSARAREFIGKRLTHNTYYFMCSPKSLAIMYSDNVSSTCQGLTEVSNEEQWSTRYCRTRRRATAWH